MKKSVFRFKHFSVEQDKCAMKVNTDGVLLGAWADVDNANNILDIGTGTGVIALMMAQKNATAQINAIDIDADAYLQAKENFELSVWSNRLTSFHSSLQEFRTDVKYDVIISNPPYFIDDLKTGNDKKNIAKHSVALTYDELMIGVANLLAADGAVMLVIPAFNFSILEEIARTKNLFVTSYTEVVAVEDKVPYLVLVKLKKTQQDILRDKMTIQHRSGIFTDEYKMLTKDFYLKF